MPELNFTWRKEEKKLNSRQRIAPPATYILFVGREPVAQIDPSSSGKTYDSHFFIPVNIKPHASHLPLEEMQDEVELCVQEWFHNALNLGD